MERITKEDLRLASKRWLEAVGVPADDWGRYQLESWSPGDRFGRRYRLECDGNPVGKYYSMGANAMYDWLWAGIYALEEAARVAKERKVA